MGVIPVAATLAKVVQLGTDNQVEVAKVILVAKLPRVGSPTPEIIMSTISIKPIMSKISIMFIMSITSTMSIMSMEVAILVGMVMGKTRAGVIIKERMEKENMAEVIKVLGVATAMDLAKTQVVPKAVEVGMAVTTSQTGRFVFRKQG